MVFIASVGYHLHLGVQEMMLKEVPALRAQGRMDEARYLVQLNFSFFFCMLSLAAGALAAAGLLLPSSTPAVQRWGWTIAGAVMVLEVLFYFEQVVARTMGYFNSIGSALLFTNIVSLILTFWLVIRYGIVGLYGVAIFTPLFGLILLHRRTKYPFRFVWSGSALAARIPAPWVPVGR